jgi:ArsR family transcriptional regulator
MDEIASLASGARALGHPMRVRIVRLLAAQPECSGSELFASLPLAQSTVSEHLRVLKDAGLITARQAGARVLYCLEAEAISRIADELGDIVSICPTCPATPGLALADEKECR